MVNWEDIHSDFTLELQQEWEKNGLTYQDAQAWIAVGFAPYDYYEVGRWKNLNLTPQLAKFWREINLTTYSRGKDYQSNRELKLEQLRKEFNSWQQWKDKSAQKYLDNIYLKEQRNTVKKLDINNKNLTGSLDLSDFDNLEHLNCSGNRLTSLNFGNCAQLSSINCRDNLLTNIVLLTELTNLKYLDLGSNNFAQDLSFLKEAVNLEILMLWNNKFYGSLEPLKEMEKLRILNIRNTDINSGLEHLPESVKCFYCSAYEEPKAKCQAIYNLFANDQGEIEMEHGEIKNLSQQLQDYKHYKQWRKLNFSRGEIKEWKEAGLAIHEYYLGNYFKQKNLTPQQIKGRLEEFKIMKQSEEQINQFIQKANLKKILYEHLDNIEYLTQGGFGKIYQAEWEDKNVILKSLDNSQELSSEFLREIASHKLFNNNTKIVKCYGVSQNPGTKEYVMVMEYIRGGNLRQYLQKNARKLDLKKKLIQLRSIAEGLRNIHAKGLVHKDFHSGNILSSGKGSFFTDLKCHITDLGLCRPANETNQENVYGVLPYVAPEVLNGKLYTQAADIYSFGIVTYEVISDKPPYHEFAHDSLLAFRICEGLRPNLEELKIPWLLKDLINRCWDADPEQRPSANDLEKILRGWQNETKKNKDTEFVRQVQEIEKLNQEMPKNKINPTYQIHPSAFYTSRRLDFKNLPQPRNSKEINEQFYTAAQSLLLDLPALPAQSEQELVNRTKRQLSHESQTKTNQGQVKQQKVVAEQDYQSDPMEIEKIQSNNWTNLHPSFTPQLIQDWQNHGFTCQQIKSWFEADLNVSEANLAAWLRDEKSKDIENFADPFWVKSIVDINKLRKAYQENAKTIDTQQAQIQQNYLPKP